MGYYVVVKSNYMNMLVIYANPRGLLCFMCLMLSLSGPFVLFPLGPELW